MNKHKQTVNRIIVQFGGERIRQYQEHDGQPAYVPEGRIMTASEYIGRDGMNVRLYRDEMSVEFRYITIGDNSRFLSYIGSALVTAFNLNRDYSSVIDELEEAWPQRDLLAEYRKQLWDWMNSLHPSRHGQDRIARRLFSAYEILHEEGRLGLDMDSLEDLYLLREIQNLDPVVYDPQIQSRAEYLEELLREEMIEAEICHECGEKGFEFIHDSGRDTYAPSSQGPVVSSQGGTIRCESCGALIEEV